MLLAGVAATADLDSVKAEPNLEKRSRLALENADRALKDAREAYKKGEMGQATSLIQEIQDSVLLAEASLNETGKNPRKSPKWFKRAEIQTRNLIRKLDAFGQEMGVDDRPMLATVKAKVQQVHDDLLLGVMEGKK
jgi:hypothetical protein